MTSSPPSFSSAGQLVQTIKKRWFAGETADTCAALAAHPELLEDRSAVLDLIYEEFCQRRQEGEALDPEEFAARFPSLRSSIRRILLADLMLAGHPSLVDGYQPVEADWPVPGTTLGDFTVLRELGRGAFARVYLATEASTGQRPVAVKLSRMGTGEACTLGRIHHEHIMPVLWAERDPATGWQTVCMPYLGCATLHHVLDHLYGRGRERPRRAAAILEGIARAAHPEDPVPDQILPGPALAQVDFVEGVRQLAIPLVDALRVLHRGNNYHCDLKPSNILLTPTGRPLLLDFNLARSAALAAVRIGGTAPYMSPEQLRAWKAGMVVSDAEAAQADLFALGVVLYELLTGEHPFGYPQGDTPETLRADALRRIEAGLRPLRTSNPEVPVAFARVIESCLATDPARRPVSAEALAADLRRCAPTRRYRLLGGTIAVASLLMVMLGAALARSPSERGPQPALVPSEPDRRSPGWQLLAEGERLLARGEESQAHALFRQAETSLARASADDPDQTRVLWKDYFGRGRALALLGEPVSALAALDRADRLHTSAFQLDTAVATLGAGGDLARVIPLLACAQQPPRDPRLLACRAWCLAWVGQHGPARLLGEQALSLGFRTPGLLNLVAYSSLQLRETAVVRRYLDEALRRQPDFQPARRNRALLDLNTYLMRFSRDPSHRLPAGALVDIEAALATGRRTRHPESADLYLQAARLYACSAIDAHRQLAQLAGDDQAGIARAREAHRTSQQRVSDYLARACILGADATALLRDPLLVMALGSALDVAALGRLPQKPGRAALTTYLVDPLPACPE